MLTDISVFLLRTLTHLILLVVLLRLFLQLARANFRNPLAQAIMQLTSPLVVPVRRIVPPIGKIDTATVIVAYAVQLLLLVALFLLVRTPLGAVVFVDAAIGVLRLSVQLYFYAIIGWVILSWISPGSYNPVSALLDDLLRPFLAPFRRILPPLSGLDLSPLAAGISLGVAMIVINNLDPIAWT